VLDHTRSVFQSMGVTVLPAPFRTTEALGGTFADLAANRPDALLVIADITFLDLRERIARLALDYRLPSIAPISEFAEAGGLAAYGPSRREIYRHAAWYVKQILDGIKAAELPVQQPAAFKQVINLKTAKMLGLTVPQSILAGADEVIE
jgi:putative ABC transport system substrate-binding protein